MSFVCLAKNIFGIFFFRLDESRLCQLHQILGELGSMDHHLWRIFLCREYKPPFVIYDTQE